MGKTRAGMCIWCGHNRVNREDVIARWIGRTLHQLVPPDVPGVTDITSKPIDLLKLHAPAVFTKRKIGRAIGPKRFIVCASCNGGWMSLLERRTQPHMGPLMLGEPRSELSESTLLVLNTWMTKTAIVIDSAEDTPPIIPQALRDKFRENPRPLPGTRIWLGQYSPEYGHLTERYCLKVKRANPGGTLHDTIELTTLALGYLVLQFTISVLSDGTVGQPQRRTPNEFLRDTWPATGACAWPPGASLDVASIEDLAVPQALRTKLP